MLIQILVVLNFICICFFFFNDTATTEIYTLSLHDALPICRVLRCAPGPHVRDHGLGVLWRGQALRAGHLVAAAANPPRAVADQDTPVDVAIDFGARVHRAEIRRRNLTEGHVQEPGVDLAGGGPPGAHPRRAPVAHTRGALEEALPISLLEVPGQAIFFEVVAPDPPGPRCRALAHRPPDGPHRDRHAHALAFARHLYPRRPGRQRRDHTLR